MKDIDKLKKAYEDAIWMAIRYAHGSSTYAPSMVRSSVKAFKEVFPDWKPRHDITVHKIEGDEGSIYNLPSDSLHDLFEDNK
jgi:hypothetical protein